MYMISAGFANLISYVYSDPYWWDIKVFNCSLTATGQVPFLRRKTNFLVRWYKNVDSNYHIYLSCL